MTVQAGMLFFTTATGGGGFANAKSLSMLASSKSMHRTNAAPTSTTKFTYNFWVLIPADFSGSGASFILDTDSSFFDNMTFFTNAFQILLASGGAGVIGITSTLSNNTWYQITIQFDTTNATAASRCKIFVNGTDVTDTSTAVTQNYPPFINGSGVVVTSFTGGDGIDPMLIDEYAKIDGLVVAPSSFSSGGHPADLSGLTFGNNGIWTRFETGVIGTIGTDSSGKGNNWTNSTYVVGDFSSTVPYGIQ